MASQGRGQETKKGNRKQTGQKEGKIREKQKSRPVGENGGKKRTRRNV